MNGGPDEALVLSTLRIDAAAWRRVRAAFAQHVGADDRLDAAAVAWATVFPETIALTEGPASACPACGAQELRATYARSTFVVGRCASCGHGALVKGAAPTAVYSDPAYYQRRDEGGSGYERYGGERNYREAKGARLIHWIEERLGRGGPGSLLEVGCGFGFTRKAAEDRGWKTWGVDVSPEAARAARELYGQSTFTGSLSGWRERKQFDVVLYQFVLEHLADPCAELKEAAKRLAAGGSLVLVVPSMDALEIDIFGAAYRSFRTDHIHLFSVRSLDRCLSAAQLQRVALTSECNLNLLSAFVDQDALRQIYADGLGPDLLVIAQERKAT